MEKSEGKGGVLFGVFGICGGVGGCIAKPGLGGVGSGITFGGSGEGAGSGKATAGLSLESVCTASCSCALRLRSTKKK